MIIDSHCHAGPGDGFSGPWDSAAHLGSYLRRATRAGIHRTVLFGAFHSDYRHANRVVARLVRSKPNRFFGFTFVHAERDRGRIRSMVEEMTAFGFCGIKVHRRDARISREVCEVATAYHLPVLYDVMNEVAPVELLANEFPRVAFIIPHLGSFADDFAAQTALIDILARIPNVYADTAGVRRFDVLEHAVRRAGPGKILFGTDGPWLHPAVELEKIRVLRLSPQDTALVLSGNFLRVTAQARRRTHHQLSRLASSICSARSVTFKSFAAC